MIKIPLGEKESLALEFKGRDTLKDLSAAGREVVAMLNAQGGEIWVGLREEQGRAVLVEGLEKPELERQRLRDYLVDSIEPQLSTAEVQVEPVPDETGQVVLRLVVKPSDASRPYALLKQNARYFLTRFEDRLRLMTREEILGRGKEGAGGQRRRATKEALSERNAMLETGKPRLWLRIAPSEALQLDLPSAGVQSRLGNLFLNPPETRSRWSGLPFVAFTRNETRKPGQERYVGGDGEYSQTEVGHQGVITSWVGLRSLESRDTADKLPILNAWYLMEYPASVLRLAQKVYSDEILVATPPQNVLIDFAICGLAGQRLKPYSPLEWGLERRSATFAEGRDFLLQRPLELSFGEFADNDRAAFRLMRQLYAAFGFSDTDIPREFDRKTGRLMLPE